VIGAEADAQFRLGSITKTFTAVLVMQCRDDGLLDLDDPVGTHLDVPEALRDLSIRRLLSHTSGLQREPYGDVWATLNAPGAEQLLAELDRAERVLPSARRFHYSNLAFALLGLVVAKRRGGTWAEVLRDRITGPFGLGSITPTPERPTTGYLVEAYSDHAKPEPPMDCGGIAPAGQLWGTAPDLARWAAYLADPQRLDPDGAVLASTTLDEMRWPLTVTDEALWAVGLGLGLMLVNRGERVVHVGHDGAMPGFLAAAFGRRGPDVPPALGVAVMSASGTATQALDLAHELLGAAAEHDPADIEAWTPGEPAPEHLRPILGPWWSEGFEYVFFWKDGALRIRAADAPAGRPPSVFEEIGTDLLRTVSGREVGELLRLTRDPGSGEVVHMHWATYKVTRRQETFTGA
jgi:CubicO group peptidase (beta-lactamase class C family)